MITITLGIIITIFMFYFCVDLRLSAKFVKFIYMLSAIIIGVSIFIGVCSPISGYTDWEKKEEIQLAVLLNSTGVEEEYFVNCVNGIYQYRYIITLKASKASTQINTEYKTTAIKSNFVEEIEDLNCEKAMLYIYSRKGKASIWTFAFGTTENKYVFYVPKGTIQHQIE